MNESLLVGAVLALMALLARMTNKRYDKHDERIVALEKKESDYLLLFVLKTDYDKRMDRLEAQLIRIEQAIDNLK